METCALIRGPSVVNPCLFGLRRPIEHKTISSCPVICLGMQKGIQESTWTRTPDAYLGRLQTGVSLSQGTWPFGEVIICK